MDRRKFYHKRLFKPMEWPKLIYDAIGVRYPVASLIAASALGAFLFGGGWWLIGKQWQKEHPPTNGAIAVTGPAVPEKQQRTGDASSSGANSPANTGSGNTFNYGDTKKPRTPKSKGK